MIANSKLVYGLIRLLNLLTPSRISKYLKYFLFALSFLTRNTIFLAMSLIFILPSDFRKDFRVKFSWIIFHSDMLVVDAWRLTDLILYKSYSNFYQDNFYSLQSKFSVISAFLAFDLLSSHSQKSGNNHQKRGVYFILALMLARMQLMDF